jgi:hypothetical protein
VKNLDRTLTTRRTNLKTRLSCYYQIGYYFYFDLLTNAERHALDWKPQQLQHKKRIASNIYAIFSECGSTYIWQVQNITINMLANLSSASLARITAALKQHHQPDVQPEDAQPISDINTSILPFNVQEVIDAPSSPSTSFSFENFDF